ncbi:hypothetical protein TrVGV298_000029 [Trichoderma virens]|nr:hypothetical protein TrVGV298_000029 [Trichoderma virens]UKZ72395.1 hypothetical protein TrVFT333_000024 [Trichoderma virens FT-333]
MSLSNNLNRSPKPQDHVWYFAYGSNLSSEIFRAHRGIQPLEAIPVRLPGWSLTFDIYGVPYQEPAFLSISVAVASTGKNSNGVALPDVHGTAYLVDRKAYYSIIASEGGGTAYEEIARQSLGVPVSGTRILWFKEQKKRTSQRRIGHFWTLYPRIGLRNPRGGSSERRSSLPFGFL